jgi:AcrR family transcriptional regulator
LQVVIEEVGVSRAPQVSAMDAVRAAEGSGTDQPETAAESVPAAEASRPERPLRADAQRNRDALLSAAAGLYAERGVDCSLEEIARRAGVGIGTLYRHFPTRDALIEAVYRREVEIVCDSAAELLATEPADAALSDWMRAFARYVATKKGMAAALKPVLGPDNELFAYSRRRIHEALNSLVTAAAASGAIRADVNSDDLLSGMSGICMATDTPGWADRTERLVQLLIDGLRYGAPVG